MKSLFHSGQLAEPFRAVRCGQFCGCGGSGCAQIRRKIGNGEVRIMTHCGNHGNGTFVNGARHRFLIEIPQILNGAASASYNEHVHGRETVEGRSGPRAHGCGYFVLRSCPLHAYGQQISLHPRGAAFQYVPYVLDDGAGGGGDDADGAGERGNFLLCSASNNPSRWSLAFNSKKRVCKSPCPAAFTCLMTSWSCPRSGYTVALPRTWTFIPSWSRMGHLEAAALKRRRKFPLPVPSG